ncbi:MAG: hypothetical protein K9G49_00570 [Taibaiella sp.]|nr:hypothetical protein [Taibaiella sp.]
MLRILLLFIVFLSSALHPPSMAQDAKQRVPLISLGRISRPEVKNGKMIPTPTTRQQILKNSLLLADVNNCRVTEYKFTILAPGKGFYGPIYVTGSELTDSIKNKIKQTDGPDVKLYIEEIKMNYRGTIMDASSIAVKYDQ